MRSPLSWKWKIPLQIPPPLTPPHPTPPQVAKKLQGSSRKRRQPFNHSSTAKHSRPKNTLPKMKSQSTSPGCTAASLLYAKHHTDKPMSKENMRHAKQQRFQKDTHRRISSFYCTTTSTPVHTQAAPCESFVAIKREI